jgi:hypothetical protein
MKWESSRMPRMLINRKTQGRLSSAALLVLFGLLLPTFDPRTLSAAAPEGTTWAFSSKPETVDSAARFTSLAVDDLGNVHLAYTNEGDHVFYAFRDVNTGKWFHAEVDTRASFVFLSLDRQGNPSLCYTQRTIRYAHWNGRAWNRQEVSPGSGAIAYYCSVRLSTEGVPHVTWYQERTAEDTNYLHMRHAFLDNGQWLVKTLDWDAQTGKWHSMVLDAKGVPHVSFDAFVSGQLKYAVGEEDGTAWHVVPVDSRRASQEPGRGMGNSLVLNAQGLAMISYFEDSALKYARQKPDGTWSTETLAPVTPSGTWAGYRSVQVLDSKGFPHVVYEDAGVLRHIFWTGSRWQSQLIAHAGPVRLRYGAIAIGKDDVIYISYHDPDDDSVVVVIGHPTAPSETAVKQ